MRNVFKCLMVTVFSLTIFSDISFKNSASAAAAKPLKILQLTNESKETITSTSSYEVTTMEMKNFVAQRKDLDGLFDVIYIADGDYSPILPNRMDIYLDKIGESYSNGINDTTNRMNDITELKANDIINYYVKKGLPVLLHESLKNQLEETNKISSKKSILKDKLYSLVNKSYKNVISVKKKSDVEKYLKAYKNNRPRVTITSSNTNDHLSKGDYLTLTFNVSNTQTPDNLVANLSFDLNFDNQYEVKDTVITSNITKLPNKNGQYTISYKLPNGYSGMRSWKLEIVDEKTNLKDYEIGTFQYKGTAIEINVLQVVDSMSIGNIVQILKTDINGFVGNDSNQTGIYTHEDFKIHIDVVSKDDFTSENKTGPTNYKQINNGNYNMLIFGFANDYGSNAQIFDEPNASKVQAEVDKYLNQGKSLFLTHDTILRGKQETNGWIKNFLERSGQTYPLKNGTYLETNMGYKGKTAAYEAMLVNGGLMTMYPYQLTNASDTITINKTHAQYYAINLEDEEIIPWFNLYNHASLKGNDAWNHYYTYSYKNITYSGAGHSAAGFDRKEKELFINTMYRAFLGANTEPIIEPIYPLATDKVYSYQNKVLLEYIVEDLDLDDRYLQTKATVNGVTVYNKEVISGSQIIAEYELNAQDQQLAIEIEASDKSGNTKKIAWTVDVETVNNGLKINKNFVKNLSTDKLNQALSNGYVQVNTPLELNYTISADSIIYPLESTKFTEDTSFVYDFYEFIPNGITADQTKSYANLQNVTVEKVENGTIVNGQLPPFEYEVKNNELHLKKSSNQKIEIMAYITPTEKNTYDLNQTTLSNGNQTIPFGSLKLTVLEGLKEIKVEDVFLKTGNEKKASIVFPESIISSSTNIIETIQWEMTGPKGIASLSNTNLEYSVVSGLKEGSTTVQVTVTDIFGNIVSGQMNIFVDQMEIVVDPNPIKVGVGHTKDVRIEVLPTFVDNKEVSVKVKDTSIASWDNKTFQLIGFKEGKTTLLVTSLEDASVTKEVDVYVGKLTIQVIPNPMEVEITESIGVSIQVQPTFFPNKEISVQVEDEKMARFNAKTNQLTGLKEGQTRLIVTSLDDTSVKVYVNVKVTNHSLKEMKFTKPYYQLTYGQRIRLMDYLVFNPTDVDKETLEKALNVNSSFNDKVKVVYENGQWYLEANETGTSLVTVTAPKQIDGTTPDPATTYFEVVKQQNNNQSPTNGKW